MQCSAVQTKVIINIALGVRRPEYQHVSRLEVGLEWRRRLWFAHELDWCVAWRRVGVLCGDSVVVESAAFITPDFPDFKKVSPEFRDESLGP